MYFAFFFIEEEKIMPWGNEYVPWTPEMEAVWRYQLEADMEQDLLQYEAELREQIRHFNSFLTWVGEVKKDIKEGEQSKRRSRCIP